jgi:hypothetical protein
MLTAWAGLTAAFVALDASVSGWSPGEVIAVGPSNFSLCSGSFASGPSVVLFHAVVNGEEETELHASLQAVAAEAYRRELRVRVCKARLSTSAGDVQHVDSVQWRGALSEVLSDAKADQLRALLRLLVPRVLLLQKGRFADFTSGEASLCFRTTPSPARWQLGTGARRHGGSNTLNVRCNDTLPLNPGAGAEVHDLLDNLARYTAPATLFPLTAFNFTRVLDAAPLMLVAFSVRWCARCAALSLQLHRAAILLPSLQPAVDVSIATIDMDDPLNAPLLKEVGAALL